MPRILVDPDLLYALAEQLNYVAVVLHDRQAHLSRAWSRLRTWHWEGHHRARAEWLWGQARRQFGALAEHLFSLARFLRDRAAAFEEADVIGVASIDRAAEQAAVLRSAVAFPSRLAEIGLDLLGVLAPTRTDLHTFSRFVKIPHVKDWLRPFVRDARRRPWPKLRPVFSPGVTFLLEVVSEDDYSWKGFVNAGIRTLLDWGAEHGHLIKGISVPKAVLTLPILGVRILGSESMRSQLDRIEKYSTPNVDDILDAWRRPSLRNFLKLVPGIKMLVDPPPVC
ncbi:MAG TPA: hypothetical protein EYH27_03415 [Anaerolineales bacterium]|nr:hypothetical protein [Anaerolineales bacterium]